MAIISRGYTFSATETVTNSKLHQLVDDATITAIVDADISAGAAIQFSKLLASSIDGSLLVNLPNIVSGAGKIPFANLPVPFGASYVSLVSIPNSSLLPLTLASWVDGAAMRNIGSLPSLAGQLPWYSVVGSLASGSYPQFNGSSLIGSVIQTISKSALLWMATIPTGTSYTAFGANQIGGADNHEIPIPLTATIKNLYLKTTNSGGNTVVVTLRKNTADTTLTATIGNTGTLANDSTHSVGLSVGDNFGLSIVNNRGLSFELGISAEIDI